MIIFIAYIDDVRCTFLLAPHCVLLLKTSSLTKFSPFGSIKTFKKESPGNGQNSFFSFFFLNLLMFYITPQEPRLHFWGWYTGHCFEMLQTKIHTLKKVNVETDI